MLEPLQGLPGLVGGKPKQAASGKCVVFTVEIDAGVVAAVMKDTPHVRTNSTNIEDIVQGFVYRPHRGDGIVVTVVRDIQQKERLCDGIDKVEANKFPGIRFERVKRNPTARQHCKTHRDFDPHGAVGLGRNTPFGKEIVEAAAQDFRERGRRHGIDSGVPQRGL